MRGCEEVGYDAPFRTSEACSTKLHTPTPRVCRTLVYGIYWIHYHNLASDKETINRLRFRL